MSDTNPPAPPPGSHPPASGSQPPSATVVPHQVTILTGGHSIVPPPPAADEKHPIMKAAKWVGAVVAILSGLAAAVTGIWNVGILIDDLNDTRAELAGLHESFEEYQEETGRRNEIQAEILNNLRIAVASIQAVAEYRSTGSPSRPATRPATRPRTTPRVVGDLGGSSVATSAVRRPPESSSESPSSSGSPTLVADTARLEGPEFSDLMRSLPPLPPPPPPSPPGRDMSEEASEIIIDHESATADVALERVEILQDAL